MYGASVMRGKPRRAAQSGSSRCRNASRLRVDSPRETRQSHSRFIELQEAEGQQLVERGVRGLQEGAEQAVEGLRSSTPASGSRPTR